MAALLSSRLWLPLDGGRVKRPGLYFGCVVLDGDFENAEWGYFTIVEMGTAPGLMVLCRKPVKRLADVVAEVKAG